MPHPSPGPTGPPNVSPAAAAQLDVGPRPADLDVLHEVDIEPLQGCRRLGTQGRAGAGHADLRATGRRGTRHGRR